MRWIGLCVFGFFALHLHGTTTDAATAPSTPASSPSPSSAVRVLTLNEAYALALERSESLAINREEIRIAEARYWQAVSAVLPQVSFLGSLRTQNNVGGSIGGDSTGARKDRWEGRLSITQTLFSGFREWNTSAALKADQRALAASLQRNRQLLYLDVSDLYHQVTTLEEDERALTDILAALQDRQTELTDRVAIGRSRKSELLAAQTELADTQATRESLRGLLGAARELFAYLIGVPAHHYALAPRGPLPAPDKLQAYLWHSGTRPDITAAAEGQTAAQRRASAARGAFLPTLSGQFNYLALEDPERDQEWNIVLTMEVPVFDGGLRVAQLNEQKANTRASTLNLSRARRLADNDVRLAYNNFSSAGNQTVQLQAAEQTARLNYEAQKEDYALGRASNLDVLSALLRWKEIIRRRIAAESQTYASLVALQVAAGTIQDSAPGKK
jgi:outer membrane protein